MSRLEEIFCEVAIQPPLSLGDFRSFSYRTFVDFEVRCTYKADFSYTAGTFPKKFAYNWKHEMSLFFGRISLGLDFTILGNSNRFCVMFQS